MTAFSPILSFGAYFALALVLLATFVELYMKVTPYNDFEQIMANNVAAAITLAGAVVGFALPIAAAVFFTHQLQEMAIWGVIGCTVQVALFSLLRARFADEIARGSVAPAVLLAGLSISLGLICASCVS
jgi:putative membrane protein